MVLLGPPGESGRGRRPRRPSPILIPGKWKPSVIGRLGDWLRGLFPSRKSGKKKPGPTPVTEVQTGLQPGLQPGHPPGHPPDHPPDHQPDPQGTSTPPPEPKAEEQEAHRATIHMLPGRLEPLLPEVIQQEVRFQRANGGEQEVTLGWELGDPPHHVTLDHPSIQPLHAKMTYQLGRWMIESLSPNDPVEVNGTPVPSTAGPYLLATGDQVRIGEALFRFFLP